MKFSGMRLSPSINSYNFWISHDTCKRQELADGHYYLGMRPEPGSAAEAQTKGYFLNNNQSVNSPDVVSLAHHLKSIVEHRDTLSFHYKNTKIFFLFDKDGCVFLLPRKYNSRNLLSLVILLHLRALFSLTFNHYSFVLDEFPKSGHY